MELTATDDAPRSEPTLAAAPSFAVSLPVSVLSSIELVGLIIGLLLIGSIGCGDLLG